MCLFAAVDKVQLATGALYGFSEDNHLHGQEYSWLGSILSLGVPSSLTPTAPTLQSPNNLLDACGYLAFNLSYPSIPGRQIHKRLLHLLVVDDSLHSRLS